MQDVGSQVTHKQTCPDPLFLEPEDCNKETSHSDTLSVFLQLQSWLCVGMFCKRMIFCVSYMPIHVLMSLIIVTMKVWTVTVTVTSPQLVHIKNWDLLLVHWPHNFHTHFSSHITRQFYNSVRLARTLLHRKVGVCDTGRANKGIPRDLEGEVKHLKKDKSAFLRNGDVMVQVWNDRTCGNDKYDPWRNNCKQREERQENKPGNKGAFCYCPVQ